MKQAIEQSFVFIKPGNFGYCLEIFECLNNSLKSDFSKQMPVHLLRVPEKIIREHYKDIKGEVFYEATIQAFLTSERGIVLTCYSGKNIIQRVRETIENTNPKKAKQGTIRRIFSNDSLEVAFRERRYLNNVIHSSSSREDAERELKLWKDYL